MTTQTNITHMFAALRDTNEALLRTISREELYQQVCDAAVGGEKFIATAVLISKTSNQLQYEAGAGAGVGRLSSFETPVDLNSTKEKGPASLAFHAGQPCIINDYLNDERVRTWREAGVCAGIGAAAAVPIISNGHGIGIFVFFLGTPGAFVDEIIGIAERIAGNVSIVMDRLEREAEKNRVSRMVSALSASNEAILRAETREKLFQLVCDAAVLGGRFTSTLIALAKPGSDFLHIVAATGSGAAASMAHKLAATAALPEGHGLSGIAFRTKQPCVTNDYLADQRLSPFHDLVRTTDARSGAALPLLRHGQAVGILLFVSAELNTFTPEFVELLQRLAGNVSFALDNFDRADEKEQAEERIRYLATHDSLTNLPNRAMFNQLLTFSIKTAKRYQRQCAVLFIDLDRFKLINDSLGHEAGDSLLVEVASRLRNGLRASDIVARLGGDEFMILLNETTDCQQITTVAQHLLSILSKPLNLSGLECRVTASIGIAIFPDDGTDEHSLMRNADTAMYLAKSEGKNDVRFFSNEIKTQSTDHLTMETDLRQALERDEFCLHYQPKLDVATGQIAGVEALLHWNHPKLGLLPPMQFIPLAEETGVIVPIGRWVLQTACAQNMAWQRDGLLPMSMAVNVSPRQFSDEHLLRDIDVALSSSGMDPKLLQIEITESMLMLNIEKAISILDAIQSRGVRLAIDDFGTGYSSMSALKRFPIDTIKIDRSFVRDLPRNAGDKAIAHAIINMGKALGLTIVAEGVETIDQDAFLRDLACDEIQGFRFSKPVPASQITELLRVAALGVTDSTADAQSQ